MSFLQKLGNTKTLLIGFALGFIVSASLFKTWPYFFEVLSYLKKNQWQTKISVAKELKNEFKMQSMKLDWEEPARHSYVLRITYCPSLETQRTSKELQEKERRKIACKARFQGFGGSEKILVVAQCPWARGSPFWKRLLGIPNIYTFGETLHHVSDDCY